MNENFVALKEQIVNFSNSYFNLYHDITLVYEVGRLDQIANFHITALHSLKRIGDENLFDNKRELNASIKKLKRLINEIVLLQYQTKMKKGLLISFLEESNTLIEFLENIGHKKTPN